MMNPRRGARLGCRKGREGGICSAGLAVGLSFPCCRRQWKDKEKQGKTWHEQVGRRCGRLCFILSLPP